MVALSARLLLQAALALAAGVATAQEDGPVLFEGGPNLRISGFFSQRLDAQTEASFGDADADEEPTYSSVTSIGLSIISNTPRSSFVFAPGVSLGVDAGGDDSGANIRPRFDGVYNFRGKRTSFSANANVTPELGALTRFEDDSVVGDDEVRLSVGLGASMSHRLDPRSSVNLGVRARFRSFEDSLENNRSVSANAGLRRAIDPLGGVSGTFQVTRFDTEDGEQVLTYTTTAGADRRLSPTLSISGDAGASLTQRDDEDDDLGFTGGLSIRRSLPRGSLSFGVNQSVDQNSRGDVENTTRFNVNYAQPLTAFSRFSVTGDVSLRTPVFGDVERERTALRIGPRLTTRLDGAWNMVFGYNFRGEDDDGRQTTSHLVFLQLSRGLSLLP